MTLSPDDSLHRFQLERAGVRGAHVRLDAAWRELRTHGDYANALGELLGQALAASALFASTIKFDGRLSVQLQDSGALKLLFAECTHDGHVRGIARWDGTAPIRLDANANLAITIENRVTQTRYQGIVPSRAAISRPRSSAISSDPSNCRRASCSRNPATAAPASCCSRLRAKAATTARDADGWNRASHLLATLTQEELLTLSAEDLLLRLFHEDGVRRNRRSRSRSRAAVRASASATCCARSAAECEETLAEQSSIQVDCEFCNRRYVFDAPDVAELFAAEPPTESEPTRH
jgi:molecular chaperone Hsp33